jgi:hypothetical protein
MSSNLENRYKTRFDHESAVTLEDKGSGVHHSARMYNYSDCGLYLEADLLLEPATEMCIGITRSPFAAEPNSPASYHGIIKWRKTLKRSAYYYGYGIEITEEDSALEGDRHQLYESRQHPRLDYVTPVKYKIDNQTFEGTTENVSRSGVFIKTPDPVAASQKVTIDIPSKEKGKIKRLTAKVTWSTPNGFGAKFIRSK